MFWKTYRNFDDRSFASGPHTSILSNQSTGLETLWDELSQMFLSTNAISFESSLWTYKLSENTPADRNLFENKETMGHVGYAKVGCCAAGPREPLGIPDSDRGLWKMDR